MSELETAPHPAVETPITDLLPASVRERVTIGPPADWVVIRGVDSAYRGDAGSLCTYLLHDVQWHAVQHTGYVRTVQRLETMKAVQVLGQWRMDYFDPRTQHVVIHSLAVQRGDKTFEHAQLKRLRFLQREASLEYSVIDGAVTVMVVLEDVRVGDVLDVSYSVRETPRLLPDLAPGPRRRLQRRPVARIPRERALRSGRRDALEGQRRFRLSRRP